MTGQWVVSGGAGYVGAHVTAALGAAGLPVVVLDDLSTGRRGRVPDGVPLVVGAVGDHEVLDEVLAGACGVVHTAGPPSWPATADADLYRAHVADLAMLLAGLVRHGIRQFVATSAVPPTGHRRAGGRSTGEMGERLLTTVGSAADIATISLRCGAAVGAASHELAPERSRGLAGRAVEARRGGPPVVVPGVRRPTPDGTTVTDYVHVQDVADAHVAAVARLSAGWHGTAAYDVGTGRGTSVFGLLGALGRLTGGTVPWVEGPGCPREPAWAVADPEPAARDLRWRSTRTLEQALWSEWVHGRRRPEPLTRAAPARADVTG